MINLRRARLIILITWQICLFIIVFSAGVFSQEDEQVEQPLTTKSGLHFVVPEDWPVVKRKGLVAPISLEEFSYKRFKDLETQIEILKGDFSAKIDTLESSINTFEEDMSNKIQELKDEMNSLNEGVKEFSKSLDNLRVNYSSLNVDIKSQFESYIQQIKTFSDQIAGFEQSLYMLTSDLESMKREQELNKSKKP